MQKQRPRAHGVSPKAQSVSNLTVKLRKHDVHRNNVSIQAVDSRRIGQVKTEVMELPVPPPPQVIGDEPPAVRQQVRTGQRGHPMPSDSAKVDVLHAVTVNMDLIIARQPLHLLGHTPLRSMSLVQEWRNHRDALSSLGILFFLFHC